MSLAANELHLWRIELAGETPRERRAVARAAAETILARYLDGPALIERGTRGRPRSAPAEVAGLAFSASDSGPRAVLAIVRRAAIGVDIEVVARRRRVVTGALHPSELARIEAADPAGRLGLFLAHWTAKEAYVKALGTGFDGIEPRDVAVVLGPAAPRVVAPPDERPWSLATLEPWPGVVGAVVVAGGRPAISTFDY